MTSLLSIGPRLSVFLFLLYFWFCVLQYRYWLYLILTRSLSIGPRLSVFFFLYYTSEVLDCFHCRKSMDITSRLCQCFVSMSVNVLCTFTYCCIMGNIEDNYRKINQWEDRFNYTVLLHINTLYSGTRYGYTVFIKYSIAKSLKQYVII